MTINISPGPGPGPVPVKIQSPRAIDKLKAEERKADITDTYPSKTKIQRQQPSLATIRE